MGTDAQMRVIGYCRAKFEQQVTWMIVGAIAAGFGHGLAFLNAQQELNEVAPQERRGEVTAAFIACIYALLAMSVVGSGLLDEYLSLTAAVSVVAACLATLAAAVAVWHARVARHVVR